MTNFPQHNKIMSEEEFLASLNQNNPAIEKVCEIFETYSNGIMEIYKKDSSLYEMVKGRISIYRLPIIDKLLQVVIEARDFHEKLSGALFAYHAAAAGEDPDVWDERIWGQMYHERGYGYYFSGAYGNTKTVIITPHVYKPDRFDKDIMTELRLI